MSAERRLRTDVFMMVASKFGVLALNIVGSVVVARALGTSGRGLLAVAYSLALILIQFGTFGVLTANPYFAAREPESRARIVTNSLWLAVALGALLFGAGVVIRLVAPDVAKGLTWAQLLIALAGIPLALANQFLHSVLLGEGRTVAYNFVELALSVLSVIAVFVVLVPLNGGVTAALAVTAGGYAAGVATWLSLLLRHKPGLRPDFAFMRRLLGYGFRAYVATLIGFLVIRVDMLMVNGYLGAKQAGLYAVAVAFVDGIYLLPTIVGINLFPRVARGADPAMTAEVVRVVSVLYGAFCLLTVPFAGLAIRILYGPAFSGATSLFYWLLPGAFSLGMVTILSNHFAGRGFPLGAVLVWFAGLGINLAMNIALLPGHGTYIAALASSVAYTLLLVLHLAMFSREVGGWRALRPRVGEVVRTVRQALSRA